MKILPVLAFVLLALVMSAAAPAPTEITPEIDSPSLTPANPGIDEPSPLPQLNSCFTQCQDIREWCDAGCSTSFCHRECRDSAVECMSHC